MLDKDKAGRTSTQACGAAAASLLATALLCTLPSGAAWAQKFPITDQARATAQQTAARGIPESELSPGAPERYVVKRGDTLWGISGVYLRQPWRWPELWGMNLKTIANPHLIYPGQTLYLERSGGYARLHTGGPGETIRISPRTRYESLADSALPTLNPQLIEPFLVEPEVVQELAFEQAPRIVATRGSHSIIGNGDLAYVRGAEGSPVELGVDTPRQWRVYRNLVPMKDPASGEILGYEAQYVARATLVRGESEQESPAGEGKVEVVPVPATVSLSGAKEEVRPGDRLLPAVKQGFANYVPHAPQVPVDAQVVSLYGSTAVRYAGQNQVVAINRGSADGIEVGQVLTVLSGGERVQDKTDENKPTIKLPSEVNGIAMVFRTFERVSYVLLLRVSDAVQVGDHLVNPQQ
ncbi:LysM peptidoglycan-binding domain-containing protein [Comamonas sp. NLF-1-9]|uniref:LysM peptidoglycan-binding domain-containing protein n=1 Tax=Comamonas sp. NLF-1-9 TaxID=2853163 RepID=UPI001C4390CD|nr:LysM peptidoglycan-binding domain-containing protein [Comamonas sp. NLF-1-9]QXL83940.1 LysM peptidoglycan-binding domain-containing protein [Comamonas sp. NLF-1-9]